MIEKYHVWNGGSWRHDLTISQAIFIAQIAIDEARSKCKPEWPDYVNDIYIVQAPGDTDEEVLGDMVAFMRAVPFDVRAAPPDSGMDTFCDYILRAPCARTTSGPRP
jgi:hypothetical protein